MRSTVLDIPVDILSRSDSLGKIEQWLLDKPNSPKMVVTAYSEFFVLATKDVEFAKILKRADLVTPDGVSVLAAVDYSRKARGGVCQKIVEGFRVGGKILSGKMGETVTGVWLFEELTKKAAERGWKVFLLGGWDEVSARTVQMLLKRFPGLRVVYDAGEKLVGTDKETNFRVIKKINAFKPDILFVAYNPVKQEKWIAAHLPQLKVGVAMGVGGTFNEYLGEFKKAPAWMERSGLKWLWRVIVEPRRFGRIIRAVFVFPWLVFKGSLKK